MPAVIQSLADTWCSGRWVALGGGGYDIWRVVPRAWSLLWLTMIEYPLVEQIRSNPEYPLPEQWLASARSKSPVTLPETWSDRKDAWEPIPKRHEISEKNQRTMELTLLYLT